MRVEATGVGQHPDAGGAQGALLRSDGGALVAEGDAVGGDARHGEPARSQQCDLLLQQPPAFAVLLRRQLVGPRGRTRDDVGDAGAVREQFFLLGGLEQPGRETGGVQDRPEPVSRPGEVMTGGRRQQPGIDPAEEHPQAARRDVRDEAVASGLQFLRCGTHVRESSPACTPRPPGAAW